MTLVNGKTMKHLVSHVCRGSLSLGTSHNTVSLILKSILLAAKMPVTCFSWAIDQHHKSTQYLNNVMLHMKCNRDLVNRIEIKRLENKFQVTMNEIIKVKKRNQLISTIQACLVGLYLSLLFGLVGFIGWIFPYFIYKTQFEKRTQHNQDS
ncbi:hypothetical protein ACT5YT_06335 [Leuconostoc suionicum]|uniref:hypothetical protein n=1 Tax=Leuconostoc suionicum TaxID=1511761 RepID=UPI0040356D63